MDSLVYSTEDSWGFVGFVKKAESCQKESTNRIHETDLLNTVVRNESTKRIFEHHRWIRETNPDLWRTNPDFLRNESKLTGYESGFAKRIHVFTNPLYESRILRAQLLLHYLSPYQHLNRLNNMLSHRRIKGLRSTSFTYDWYTVFVLAQLCE